ncbi:MAG: hypothetical protein EHM45_13120 [Desulfobacteraceae bacterium]|nr:MAG: hypothetical protein EHM45_13120 [Desulfobacteraceae bacterium]
MQVESSYALIPFNRDIFSLAPPKEAFQAHLNAQDRPQAGLRFLGSKTRETNWSYDPEGRSLQARPMSGALIDLYV